MYGLRWILVNRAASNVSTALGEKSVPGSALFQGTAINTSMLQAATAPEQNS